MGLVIAYLHTYFGTTPAALAAVTAVINVAIFLVTYLIFRRMKPKHLDGSISALISSIVVALPVFIVAFIGLGYEIPIMADFGAMYILGIWAGSAEAAERGERGNC